jgi:Cupin
VRHGSRDRPPDVRLLGGYFVFDSPDAALLVSLLPALVRVRGTERLSLLVRLVGEEASQQRSGRDLIVARLVEVPLIEALRSSGADGAQPRLLRGLADPRVAVAIRKMRGDPERVDGRRVCKGGRNFALVVLRPLRARRGPAADGM